MGSGRAGGWDCRSAHPVYIGNPRPSRVASTRAVLREIETLTGLRFPVTTNRAAAHVTMDWRTPPAEAGHAAGAALTTYGSGGHVHRATVWIEPQPVHEHEIVRALRHDLAHVVGLDHVEDLRSVMGPAWWFVEGYSAADREALRSWGCMP